MTFVKELISLKLQKPPRFTRVLVFSKYNNEYGFDAIYQVIDSTGKIYWCSEVYIQNVNWTHWLPLPAPPEEPK